MDRRGFLKAAGLGAGAAVMCRVPEAEAEGLCSRVSHGVLKPEDIIKDPMIGPVFDLNDDASGLAAHFTTQLLLEYADKHGLTDEAAMSMLQWGLRQPAMLGLMLAKKVVTITFQDREQAKRVMYDPVFKEMYTAYGELLNAPDNTVGQYYRLRV